MALSTNKEGNVVTKLASATELPRMVKVRQKLDHSHIEPEEIPALVQRELEPMRSRIRAGMRVAMVPDLLPPTPELEPLLWGRFDSLLQLRDRLAGVEVDSLFRIL